MSDNKNTERIAIRSKEKKNSNDNKSVKIQKDMDGNIENISIKQDFDGKAGFPPFSVNSQISIVEQNSDLNYKTIKIDVRDLELRISFTNDKPNNIIIGFKEEGQPFPMASNILNLDNIIKELNAAYIATNDKIKPERILKRMRHKLR